MEKKTISCDVLIIGGGTAGCYAATTIAKRPDLKVVIAEKANIVRSGCLAAGVNALNAYITPGHVPQDYVDYAKKDAEGIVREDLLLTLAGRFNEVTHDLEKKGLTILKDENGNYVSRGWRNIKINGENIKPLLADSVSKCPSVEVINHLNITDLDFTEDASGKTIVTGAFGFGVRDGKAYHIKARAVLISTGGAAGLYRPNNPGNARHRTWYPPFNTGAGYAMGLMAGAEMTTFEMRFVALRCKDTIAPTGTIAQGVHAKQVNNKGEVYETKYGLTTSERVYGTVEENRKGHGPCYLDTTKITEEAEEDLYRAYLNMAPSQTLRWFESGKGPRDLPVEIEGTEPYVVGGHTASGFWIDTARRTTVEGLYAAGDVAGGAPQKYVTGALAEGEIAAETILRDLEKLPPRGIDAADRTYAPQKEKSQEISSPGAREAEIFGTYEKFLTKADSHLTAENLEDAMQKVMDEYAGGIKSDYRVNGAKLALADRKISDLLELVDLLAAKTPMDLLEIYEVRERLIVCRALIAHLGARRETRWHVFDENEDYPGISDEGLCYIESVMDHDGRIRIFRRDLVKGGVSYEHSN
ncbi:MAG: adenylyl-sulfate reductase subunit alpha [Lachnospiraceae bacterium]|nr:adenylyl-sulfate reductase subunit alpha [Lachnospiraceae bacterium]